MGKVKLGDVVQDTLTGFVGVVTARTEWLYGCIRVGVQSQELDKDGKVRDAQWFDEPQVKKQSSGSLVKKALAATGGPPRECDPLR